MANSTLMNLFTLSEPILGSVLRRFLDEEKSATIEAEARVEFAALSEEMPYATAPFDHHMFTPTLAGFQWLAVYRAARAHGIGPHELGASILQEDFPSWSGVIDESMRKTYRRDSAESQLSPGEAEFVFEYIEDEGRPGLNYEVKITQCALCHAFARHDATELLPYICAADDSMSTAGDQGLRRTGTIALGADHCDFHFHHGDEPKPLAPQYPEQIRTDG